MLYAMVHGGARRAAYDTHTFIEHCSGTIVLRSGIFITYVLQKPRDTMNDVSAVLKKIVQLLLSKIACVRAWMRALTCA